LAASASARASGHQEIALVVKNSTDKGGGSRATSPVGTAAGYSRRAIRDGTSQGREANYRAAERRMSSGR
jgi:hypothetical protein